MLCVKFTMRNLIICPVPFLEWKSSREFSLERIKESRISMPLRLNKSTNENAAEIASKENVVLKVRL